MDKQEDVLQVKAAMIKYFSEQSQQLIVDLQKDAKYLAQILTTPIPDPFKFGEDYKVKLLKLSKNIQCLQNIDQLISLSLRHKIENFDNLNEEYAVLLSNRAYFKKELIRLEELRNTALAINSL